jgi:hypothetical protein
MQEKLQQLFPSSTMFGISLVFWGWFYHEIPSWDGESRDQAPASLVTTKQITSA